MTRRVAFALALVAGLDAAFAAGQGLTAPATLGPPPSGSGGIAGTVTTTDTTPVPVRRALVVLTATDATVDRSVVTDDEGRFSLERLPAGRYVVTASKPAYVSTAYGAKRPGGAGTAISLANGQRVTGLAIALARGGGVSGTVRDVQGRPAPGVQMFVFRPDQPPQPTAFPGPDAIFTDDRGQYRAYGLAPGTYLVAGVGSAPGGGGSLAARRTEDVDSLLDALSRRSSIGRAPSTAPSSASRADNPRMFALVPTYYPGTPSLADAQQIAVAVGTERSGLDFTVAPVPVSTVEGTVTGQRPGENVTVAIAGTGGTFGLTAAIASPRLAFGPGTDGRFKYTNVPPVHHLLLAQTTPPAAGRGGVAVGPAPPTADMLWATAEVDAVGNDIAGVVLALQPSLTLVGRIVFDGAAARPRDLTALRVDVVPVTAPNGSGSLAATLFARRSRGGFFGMARADGTFEVHGLVPGTYRVTAAVNPWRLESAMVEGHDLLDMPLDLSPDRPAGDVVLTFVDRHNALVGRLQTTAGAAAPDFTVIVFPADRALWTSPRRVAVARPASDGQFTFTDLPAGTYLVAALTDVEPGAWTSSGFLEPLVPASVKVTLLDTGTTRQDLQIAR